MDRKLKLVLPLLVILSGSLFAQILVPVISNSSGSGAVLVASWYGATGTQTTFNNTFTCTGTCTVIADPGGVGNAIRIEYGPVPSNGGQPTDVNISIQKFFASLVDHYVSIQKTWIDPPQSDGMLCGQRKLSYSTCKQLGSDINGLFTNTRNEDTFNVNNTGQVLSLYNGGDGSGTANGSCKSLASGQYNILSIENYFGSTTSSADGYINISCNKVKDTGVSRTGIAAGPFSGCDQVGFSSERWGQQLDTDNCTAGWPQNLYTNMTETQSGNTVTMTFQAADQHFSSKQAGGSVIIKNCSDARLNGIFPSIVVPDQTKITFTDNAMSNVSGITGCTLSLQGHEFRYIHDIELWKCPAGAAACTPPSAIN